jgi:hypothetical protein
MANVTVTLGDKSQHTYENVPEGITPEQVHERAAKEFNMPVLHIAKNTIEDTASVEEMKPSLMDDLRKNVSEVGKQYLENLYSGYNTLAGVRQGLAAPFINVGNTVSDALTPTKLADLITDKEKRFALPGMPLENPKATSYGVGNLVGETAITAPVAGILGGTAKVFKAPPALVKAITTGGTEMGGFGKGEKLATIGRGIIGGGLTGGVSTALTDPEDIYTGTAVGAFTPHVLGVLGTGATKTYDLLSGKLADVNAGKIARQVLGENLPATRQALLNAPQELTAAQAAYGKATPAFASLEGLARTTRGEPYLAKDLASQAENRVVMGAMTPNKEQALANEAQAIANRTGQLTQGQDVLNTALANQVRQFESKTAKDIPQVPHGEVLAGLKTSLESAAQKAVIPLYAQAFELAPHKFDVSNVASAAEDIQGHLASILNPDTKPEIANAISKVFQSTPATPGKVVTNLATGTKTMMGGKPALAPQASLQDLDEVNKGITTALSDARAAAQPDNRLISNLNNLKTEVNKAISTNVSKDALSAYNTAKDVWKKTVHEPFREGEVRKLTKENVSGRPLTLPENAAKQFLKSESGAADFNRAFGNDPDAKEALNTGIEHLMMNSKNPEAFLVDNRLKLNELSKTNPDLQPRLDRLAEQLRGFKAVQGSLEAESKLIPEKVATEIANAPSAANQERVISHLRNILHPFPGQENASPFLSALEKADVSSLNAPQQLYGLNTIQAKLLRDVDLAAQAEAGKGTLKQAWKDNTFLQKLPSYLNVATSTANKIIGITEKQLASAIERKLSSGMESPENAINMLNMMPADQRATIIRELRNAGPTISRAAVLSANKF